MAQRLGQITNSNALLLAILGAFNFQFPFCVNDIAPTLDFSSLTSTRRAAAFSFLPLFLSFSFITPLRLPCCSGVYMFLYLSAREKNQQRWSLRSDSHQRPKNEFASHTYKLRQVNAPLPPSDISASAQPIKFTFVLIGSWFCAGACVCGWL